MIIQTAFHELLYKLSQYKFAIKRINTFIEKDIDQLEMGGNFIDISAIHIRDWSNHTDKNWQVDIKRLSFYSRTEYLTEIKYFKTLIFKHYIVEVNERLMDFLTSINGLDKRNYKMEDLISKLDISLHNSKTPFNFNLITFFLCFKKVRNAFVHNENILELSKLNKRNNKGLCQFDVNQKLCIAFLKAYFDATHTDQSLQLSASHSIVNTIIKFTESYALEIYKSKCVNNDIWFEKEEKEKLDIKTGSPLTDEQKQLLNFLVSPDLQSRTNVSGDL